MSYFFVFEAEYPEDGSVLIKAEDAEAAEEEWLRQTGTEPHEKPELSVSEATSDVLRKVRSDAVAHIGRMAPTLPEERMDHFREAVARFVEVDVALAELSGD